MPGMPLTVIFILHRKLWEHNRDKSISSTLERNRHRTEGSWGEVPMKLDYVSGTTWGKLEI